MRSYFDHVPPMVWLSSRFAMPAKRESVLEFPCEYIIKVVGKNSPLFEGAVSSILRKHVPDLSEGAFSLRESKEKKYLAMTVTFTATSQAQLDQIYTELSAHEEVKMAF